MKICNRGLNFVQIIDEYGTIRICSWMPDSIIGNMLQTSFKEAFFSPKAEMIRERLALQDYSCCKVDNCPYLANGNIDENLVEFPEIISYPNTLHLAYEGKCNYHCTCCTSYNHMELGKERDWSANYAKIEEGLKEVLPYVRTLGANGRGEVFASPHIMNVLANWRPLAPASECTVQLETNGSLFNEKNWKKISNLGQYNLQVFVTVMSFEEKAYQYLSGTSLPISNIISNLKFIKGLREQGIINYLELATVVQERNFREMPDFTRRCIEEFGADKVRLRPIRSGGSLSLEAQWFADVRNPYHPYYEEYKEVMKDSVFKDSHVLLWSGQMDSSRGRFPVNKDNQEMKYKLLAQLLCYKGLYEFENCPEITKIVVYGAGNIGLRVCEFMKKKSNLPVELATTEGSEDARCINEFSGNMGVGVIIASSRRDYIEAMLNTCKTLGIERMVYFHI